MRAAVESRSEGGIGGIGGIGGNESTHGDQVGDEPVDGRQLAADVEAFIAQYVAFPSPHCLTAVTLWVLHTWALPAFYVTPRLNITSPEPGCGKSRVLELLQQLCHAARMTFSTTPAALFRSIEAAGDHPPTILHDEVDTIFGRSARQAEDLRALYNSGYKRGATVDRCVGGAAAVTRSRVFAPVALAGLAVKMPSTITSRAITIPMRRRAPGETIKPYRERIAVAEAAPVRRRLQAWAKQNVSALTGVEPVMPDGVEDRPAEIWEPLIATADLISGDWPERARAACLHFTLETSTSDAGSLGVRLLADIKTAFGDADRKFSDDIVTALIADPESEWSDLLRGPLTQRLLAKELRHYGIRSQDIRIGDSNRKGYTVAGREGLGQAWDRYLPHNRTDSSSASSDVADKPESARDRGANATPKSLPDQQGPDDVADVADVADKNFAPTQPSPDRGHSPIDSGPVPPGAVEAAPEASPRAISRLSDRPGPPGGLHPDSPGQTPRVAAIIEGIERKSGAPACRRDEQVTANQPV